MATIKDVAKLAEVSPATVSRVFSGSEKVTQETKMKVQQAAAQLGYEPNLLGAALRKTQTRKILALAPTPSSPLLAQTLEGLQWKAASMNYDVLFAVTHHSPVLEKRYLEQLGTRLWDGAVFFDYRGEAETLTRLAQKIPLVQCLSFQEKADTLLVGPDYRKAMGEAAAALCGQGHRRIALLTENSRLDAARREREGYLQALESRGILPDTGLIIGGVESYETARRTTRELMHLSFPPTAILCGSDWTALGALDQARAMGLLEEVSIWGFGGTSLCDACDPPLSTVALPLDRIGQMAAELLVRKIETPSLPNRRIFLGHELRQGDKRRKK